LVVTASPDVRIEIDSIDVDRSGLGESGALEGSIAERLAPTTEAAAQVAAEIVRLIGREVSR
jgi:hypothetical protein